MAAYSESIRCYESLNDTHPGDFAYSVQLARVLVNLGRVHVALDNPPEAHDLFHRAASLLPEAENALKLDELTSYELAETLYLLSKPLQGVHPAGRPPSHVHQRRHDRMERSGLPPLESDQPHHPQLTAPEHEVSELQGIAPLFLEESINILNSLQDTHPEAPAYRHLLAKCLLIASDMPGMSEATVPENSLDRAVVILEGLVVSYPKESQYRFDLAEAYTRKASGKLERPLLEKADSMIQELMNEKPEVPEYPFTSAFILMRLSHVYGREGDYGAGELAVESALNLMDGLMKDYPDVLAYTLGYSHGPVLVCQTSGLNRDI